jgi:hypothetical protein
MHRLSLGRGSLLLLLLLHTSTLACRAVIRSRLLSLRRRLHLHVPSQPGVIARPTAMHRHRLASPRRAKLGVVLSGRSSAGWSRPAVATLVLTCWGASPRFWEAVVRVASLRFPRPSILLAALALCTRPRGHPLALPVEIHWPHLVGHVLIPIAGVRIVIAGVTILAVGCATSQSPCSCQYPHKSTHSWDRSDLNGREAEHLSRPQELVWDLVLAQDLLASRPVEGSALSRVRLEAVGRPFSCLGAGSPAVVGVAEAAVLCHRTGLDTGHHSPDRTPPDLRARSHNPGNHIRHYYNCCSCRAVAARNSAAAALHDRADRTGHRPGMEADRRSLPGMPCRSSLKERRDRSCYKSQLLREGRSPRQLMSRL